MSAALRLLLFGPPSFEGAPSGAELLAQPKRLALFAYLALGRPGGFVRRDQITAMFWPEHDATHARAALRKAVHALRALVGAETIISRGDEELALAPDRVWIDAVAFRAAVAAERHDEAQQLYSGVLLDGVHADAPGFEEWLMAERRRCQEDVVVASWALAKQHEAAASLTLATRMARQAARLAETDERTIRNAMRLLARAGDRAGALQVYEEFTGRLRRELDVEPSAETRALAEELRRA